MKLGEEHFQTFKFSNSYTDKVGNVMQKAYQALSLKSLQAKGKVAHDIKTLLLNTVSQKRSHLVKSFETITKGTVLSVVVMIRGY
jgi:hypothetical protein